ncbi:MAG: DEAD/DEAH box helicase [Deltaproteobacteria bacterium]|nr:DEAD/DEAH box helicase [Deltaproteobacteria bacterium]
MSAASGSEQALAPFSELARCWFSECFAAPTAVQAAGWAQIALGKHALLCAPTGSGKTLAAFFWCIDNISRQAVEPGVRALYVSPLKALAYDIERNLRAPLIGMQRLAARDGLPFSPLKVDVRTGDTSQRERRQQARDPGQILITTPESLYLMLGSQGSRQALQSVDTVIVDEIHALAPNKRGVHLALSLERLVELVGREFQRIGLSATQRPLERVGRFLVGARPVELVDTSAKPDLDLEIVVPVPDMSAPLAVDPAQLAPGSSLSPDERASVWPAIYPRLLALIRAHQSTIVFVNSRRLAERLAQQLNDLAGEPLARAHHGSVAPHERQAIEEALKEGRLPAIVATSSLELGIDMGAVDLVIQVESPGTVARGLQRIGRAGHGVGQRSVGRLFPKHRGDLLEATVVARGMLEGEIEPISIPKNALDVLAQQIVAICADRSWEVDALFRLVRRAQPYADLSVELFNAVLDMLAGRYPSDAFADLRPRLNWDRVADTVVGRPGAKLISLLNGGTIADRGSYAVHLGERGPKVGELDEEMVYESRAGEAFVLGATTWRIEDITRDRVVVTPAPGEPGKMPFWHGAGPGRPLEVGRALGRFVGEVSELPADGRLAHLQSRYRLDPLAARNVLDYIAEQLDVSGAVPTDQCLVIERFADELGDWRVCLLTPFGGRVHGPWALALSASLSRKYGFDVETLHTDDGIVLRFADSDELPTAEALIPDPSDVEELVVEQLRHSPLFAAQFRENAARALLLPRRAYNRRAPLWQQRLRAQQLMAVALQHGDFPIVLETYRACLNDVFDMPALRDLLSRLRSRQLRVVEVDTRRPSPFARSLVFAYVAAYLYQGDAPLAERRAQALTLDRNLLRELLGHEELRRLLDAEVIDTLHAELQFIDEQRLCRTADDLHDVLRRIGDLSDQEIALRAAVDPQALIEQLLRSRRAVYLRLAGEQRLVTVEDAARYRDALGVVLPAGVPHSLLAVSEDALGVLVERFAANHRPFVSADLAARFAVTIDEISPVLERLCRAGRLLKGDFDPRVCVKEWCHPEVLRRLRQRTLAKLRQQVAPVEARAVGRFLSGWQGIAAGRRGLPALRDAVAQLAGYPLPFSELETRILPARVEDYRPELLDQLGMAGEVVWVGCGALSPTDGRIALYPRAQLARLLDATSNTLAGEAQRSLLARLAEGGALFTADLLASVETDLLTLTEALWDLVWAGLVTNDNFAVLRELARGSRRGRRSSATPIGGRWSLVPRPKHAAATEQLLAWANLLIERYGIVGRDCVAHERLVGGFGRISRVLSDMEQAGKVRRGLFVDGLGGQQFAHPAAVDRLRASSRQAERAVVVLAATDPANPYGSLLPWPPAAEGSPSLQRRVGNTVILRGGQAVALLSKDNRRLVVFSALSPGDLTESFTDALPLLTRRRRRLSLRIDQINGVPAPSSKWAEALVRAGFSRTHDALVCELISAASSAAR